MPESTTRMSDGAAATSTGCPGDHTALLAGTARTDHHGYEPFDMTDPFPAYARLRREEPVMFDERTGYGWSPVTRMSRRSSTTGRPSRARTPRPLSANAAPTRAAS
jgi:hypothetical protein